MRSLLIRLYPASWRARYGDEFEAILEERPLGPFDAADIILGAFDAQIHLRGRGAGIHQGKGFSMSLRIGGFAAVLGGPLWAGGFLMANGVGNIALSTAAALLVAGSVALLVALTGLSAFQARVQPVLSWAAFALPAVGTLILVISAFGVAFGGEEVSDGFFFGLMFFFVGSLLFAIATYRTAVLSRGAAVVLGVAPVIAIVAGSSDVGALAGLTCFGLGWFVLGVQAVRLHGPAAALRPA